MKQITTTTLVLSALILLLTNCKDHDGYKIEGTLTGAEGKKVYITQRGGGLSSGSKIELLDSCIVNNGEFSFQGKIDEPNYYSILVEKMKGWKYFILDVNSKLTFNGNADSIWMANVSGSLDNNLLDSLNSELNFFYRKNNEIMDSLRSARKQIDTIKIKNLSTQYKFLQKEILNLRINFIHKYPNSFESLNQLSEIYDNGNNKDQTEKIFDVISDKLKQHSIGKQIHYELYELKEIFSQPISFSQPDTIGNLINTDSYRGNYLLIDFWASWCGPCRAENPNLKDLYNQYHDRGFEIIGVSLDTKKQNWLNAIQEDGLNWIHVSDLKGSKNDIVQKYGISSIPRYFLLDKEGEIIAKDLSGEKLYQKINELYK